MVGGGKGIMLKREQRRKTCGKTGQFWKGILRTSLTLTLTPLIPPLRFPLKDPQHSFMVIYLIPK